MLSPIKRFAHALKVSPAKVRAPSIIKRIPKVTRQGTFVNKGAIPPVRSARFAARNSRGLIARAIRQGKSHVEITKNSKFH